MKTVIAEDKNILGAQAAQAGALAMQNALKRKGRIAIILATGASQFEMLDKLVKADIDWSRVTIFHLDEYIGLSEDHPASFRRYLRERVVSKLPALYRFVGVNGCAKDTDQEIRRLNALIGAQEIDVCFAGIGENCHLAFNDPPADFQTEAPYIAVAMDEQCRRQQLNEGWFSRLEDVPERAISMSVRQIARSRKIILSVPDARKAEAVAAALEGPVSNMKPASFLQNHPDCTIFLDPPAAALLQRGR